MIVTLASVRGSPGVTSWAVLIAAAWPSAVDAERVVVEADLDGGVLGARYGLGVDPGVVSLIAALRRSEGLAVPVGEHGRPVGLGLWLVPGPESGEQARSVWADTAAVVADRLADDDRLWLVDAGRAHGSSVGNELADPPAKRLVTPTQDPVTGRCDLCGHRLRPGEGAIDRQGRRVIVRCAPNCLGRSRSNVQRT